MSTIIAIAITVWIIALGITVSFFAGANRNDWPNR